MKDPLYVNKVVLKDGGAVERPDGTEIIPYTGYKVVGASRHTWNEAAAAADVVTVSGVAATDVIIATINVRGTNNPTTVLSAERSAADSVTVTLDQNGENGTTVVSVLVLRAY